MSLADDLNGEDDDGFGPGSDLVLSFLGVIILLIGIVRVVGWPQSVPVLPPPPPPPGPVSPEELAAANKRIQDLERYIARMKRRAVAFRFDGTSAAFFTFGSARLTEPAQKLIAGSTLTIGRKALEMDANQIEIIGYASPEPSNVADYDTNLDLSTARAEAVTHFLAKRGIPYECMSVRGVGRGRSQLLYDMYLWKRPGTRIQDWDALFPGAAGREFQAGIENDLAEERRVDIIVSSDDESKCDPRRLQKSLGV